MAINRGTPTAVVIIPAYNATRTLDRTIASAVVSVVEAKKHLEVQIEIVVVDDVSTDETPEMAKRWVEREPMVRLVRNAVNRGPGFSRNEGVRQSSGNFIFFLDSDDVFYPNHIHTCLQALLADNSIGYVFTGMSVDMPIHSDWVASLDESNPINFCVRRVWHDMIQGFPEEPDFSTHRCEDTLYRMCLRRLVKHSKVDIKTCEQFVSPGNALDRQKQKFGMPMREWERSGITDGFVLTKQMEAVTEARLKHVDRLMGAKV